MKSEVKTILSVELAKEAARVADNEKGEDILILNVEGISNITDTFVIISGKTRNHARAIGQQIEDHLKTNYAVECFSAVGYRDTDWVALDFRNLVVHIFSPETRAYYNLERLWGDAPIVEWRVGAAQN